jgi:hypothetical protein
MTLPRSKFTPLTWDSTDSLAAASLENREETMAGTWRPLLHCLADFPVELVGYIY